MNKNWGDIPSLHGLEIEWGYEPENSLGKRKYVRISNKELISLFDVNKVLVKIHGQNLDATGALEDISEKGFAVLLYKKLTEGMMVRVGFLLGRRKVLARAEVRNVTYLDGKYRAGLEFIGLGENDASFLLGLVPSRVLKY